MRAMVLERPREPLRLVLRDIPVASPGQPLLKVRARIHMSDIPAFPYSLLWGERVVRSVANLTRQDAIEFLQIAAEVSVRVTTRIFPLEAANEALAALRNGTLIGAAVLVP